MAKFINADSKGQFPRVGGMMGECGAPSQWEFASVSQDGGSERRMMVIVAQP